MRSAVLSLVAALSLLCSPPAFADVDLVEDIDEDDIEQLPLSDVQVDDLGTDMNGAEVEDVVEPEVNACACRGVRGAPSAPLPGVFLFSALLALTPRLRRCPSP